MRRDTSWHGAIAHRRDSWVDLSSSSLIRLVINIWRRNSFSIAVFCLDIAAEESYLSQWRPFSHSPGVYDLFSPKSAGAAAQRLLALIDLSGRPLEFISNSPCVNSFWSNGWRVLSYHQHCGRTATRRDSIRFQIHQSSIRCFDLQHKETNI